MRRAVPVLAVLSLGLGILWLATRPGAQERSPVHEPAPRSLRPEPTESASAHEHEREEAAPRPSRAEAASNEAAGLEALASEAPSCRVFGRVSDENGAPLAGVRVRLQAFRRWSPQVEGPRLDEDERFRGWERSTELDGSFEWEVPVPGDDASTALSVTPGLYHDSATLRFGRDGQARLRAGDNDLGTIRLGACGALAGFVRDGAGNALEEARVRTAGASSRSTTYGRETSSDAAGRFVLGHLKPGVYGVVCEHERHVSDFRTPIEVVAGRTLELADFALAPAPTLKGRVIDEEGTPLEGIRVWGWPQGEGKGAGATSASDGSFTIHLPQDEPYRLEARLDASDAHGSGDPSVHHAPGSEGIELVLPRTQLVVLAVVDAESGAPIERFGLHLERAEDLEGRASGRYSRTVSPPQPIPRPGGELRVRVRPGADGYHVVASGYQDARERFPAELSEPARFVLRMQRGASITGRALLRGRPTQGVVATLEVGHVRTDGQRGPRRFRPETYREARSAESDAQGHFRFQGVREGETHRLTLRAPTGESLVRMPVGRGELGDLELQPAGTIEGQILVPLGRSAAGLQVRLDHSHFATGTVSDASGSFQFTGVAPGEHTLFVAEAPGIIAGGATRDLLVAPGSIERVLFDLRESGTCWVALRLRFPDEPLAGHAVELVADSYDPEQGSLPALGKRHTLGRVGPEGEVEGWAPTLGSAHVVVRGPASIRVWRHPEVLRGLTLDAQVRKELLFETARLAFQLPASLALPPKVMIYLRFVDSHDLSSSFELSSDSEAITQGIDGIALEGRRLAFARVPAGEHELVLEIRGEEEARSAASSGTNARPTPAPPILSHRTRVTLPPGGRVELELR